MRHITISSLNKIDILKINKILRCFVQQITLVGDLKNGRTVHSLAKLLMLYKVNVRYVPVPGLEMPTDIVELLRKRGIKQVGAKSLITLSATGGKLVQNKVTY